jgi:FixJ family two-component response regulator
MHPLEAGLDRRPVAVAGLRLGRVPGPDEDVLPDDDVALIAVAAGARDQLRVPRRVPEDPEPVVVAVEDEVALESEIGVGIALAVRQQEAAEVGAVAQRVHVLGVRARAVVGRCVAGNVSRPIAQTASAAMRAVPRM